MENVSIIRKKCNRCKKFKLITNFSTQKRKPKKLYSYCRSCARLTSNEWGRLNKSKRREWSKKYIESGRYNTTQKRRQNNLLSEILNHYGNKCFICGDKRKYVLTIDHINGNGHKIRKILKIYSNSYAFYLWIIRKNYPKSLRLLCFNCNCSLGIKKLPEKQLILDSIGLNNFWKLFNSD